MYRDENNLTIPFLSSLAFTIYFENGNGTRNGVTGNVTLDLMGEWNGIDQEWSNSGYSAIYL